MSISKNIVNKPTTILVLFAILVGLGLYIVPQVPIDLYPEINPPILVVFTTYDGAGPEEIEQTTTRPLEGQMGNVSDVERITSTSSEGLSMILLEFDWDTDLSAAAQDVRDKLEFIKDYLPDDAANPQIFKFDPAMMPIMDLVVDGNRTPEEIRAIAEDQIQPYLEQVPGVATTIITGGREKVIRVEISQNRLEAYNLSITQVAQILATQNIQVGAGSVEEGSRFRRGQKISLGRSAEYGDGKSRRPAATVFHPETGPTAVSDRIVLYSTRPRPIPPYSSPRYRSLQCPLQGGPRPRWISAVSGLLDQPARGYSAPISADRP
ncbi:MAG: efflux RND transporter permease subunit, partial [Spirochaetales bacterium]|nr:efflux RND transporter permease subunit [Spirochaetales bacterium]